MVGLSGTLYRPMRIFFSDSVARGRADSPPPPLPSRLQRPLVHEPKHPLRTCMQRSPAASIVHPHKRGPPLTVTITTDMITPPHAGSRSKSAMIGCMTALLPPHHWRHILIGYTSSLAPHQSATRRNNDICHSWMGLSAVGYRFP